MTGDVTLSHSAAVTVNRQPHEIRDRRSCPGLLDSFPILMLTQDLKQRAIVLKEFNPLD